MATQGTAAGTQASSRGAGQLSREEEKGRTTKRAVASNVQCQCFMFQQTQALLSCPATDPLCRALCGVPHELSRPADRQEQIHRPAGELCPDAAACECLRRPTCWINPSCSSNSRSTALSCARQNDCRSGDRQLLIHRATHHSLLTCCCCCPTHGAADPTAAAIVAAIPFADCSKRLLTARARCCASSWMTCVT